MVSRFIEESFRFLNDFFPRVTNRVSLSRFSETVLRLSPRSSAINGLFAQRDRTQKWTTSLQIKHQQQRRGINLTQTSAGAEHVI